MGEMSTASCDNERVGRADAAGLRVSDAMVAAPKTTPADATAAALGTLFANPHVLTALVVDGSRFVGVVQRDAPPAADDERPARALARRDVETIAPDAPLSEALARLDRQGSRRMVVVDRDDRLCGLLCLTADRSGFCQS
jgi:CBS domain-containing protein